MTVSKNYHFFFQYNFHRLKTDLRPARFSYETNGLFFRLFTSTSIVAPRPRRADQRDITSSSSRAFWFSNERVNTDVAPFENGSPERWWGDAQDGGRGRRKRKTNGEAADERNGSEGWKPWEGGGGGRGNA